MEEFESQHHDIWLVFFLLRGVGWDWVHLARRSLIGLLYQSRMIHKYGAFSGMRIGRGNRSTRGKSAPGRRGGGEACD
jgi:hypothetical protein